MSDSESDLDIKSALPMPGYRKKAPSSPTEDFIKISKPPTKISKPPTKSSKPPTESSKLTTKASNLQMKTAKSLEKMPSDTQGKKITTKMMIIDALTELKTRKGVSLYAIKQFLTDKYEVNTAKANYLIKKSLKAGVEDNTFVQIKGIGASGSFKLAPKEKKAKPILKEKKEVKSDKPKKKAEKFVKIKEISKKEEEIKPKKVKGMDKEIKTKGVKASKKMDVEIDSDGKKKMAKSVKKLSTPVKKGMMKKRKSIGSIRKPPKMNPKSRA